jgi:PhnB protein
MNTTTTNPATTREEAAIDSTIRARLRALSAKDAEAVFDCQTSDFVCYSLAPPLVSTGGFEGLDAWFDSWAGPIGYELRDLAITASPGVAFAHALVRMTGRKTGGAEGGVEVDLWFRQTLGLRRDGATWKIAHEHDSTPFYMDGSLRAAVDLRP